MKRTHKADRGKDYPFKIPELSLPDDATLLALSPDNILEFLRVEALLRSPKLHELFRIKDSTESRIQLGRAYGVDWDILGGSHYSWLTPEATKERRSLARPVQEAGKETPGSSKDYISLTIDLTYPHKTIIEEIKAILKKKSPAVKRRYGGSTLVNLKACIYKETPNERWFTLMSDGGPTDPIKRKRPKLRIWMPRFHWYDWHYRDRLSPETIVQEAFGIQDSLDTPELALVKKGVGRARQMIQAAEACQWPPKSIL